MMRLFNQLEKYSLRQILLIGFIILAIGSALGAATVYYLLGQSQTIIRQQQVILEAYDAAFSLKLKTEKLLTSYNLAHEHELWLTSFRQSNASMNRLSHNMLSNIQGESCLSLWMNVKSELDLIEQELSAPQMSDLKKLRKPLLSYLGERFSAQNKDRLYPDLLAAANQIEYAQQYESFLVDELSNLSKDYMQNSNLQLNRLRTAIAVVLILYLIFIISFSHLLLKLTKHAQQRLQNTQDSLNKTLEDLKLNQLALLKNRDSLDYLAHHDQLTGLPNRLHLTEKLKESIESAKSSKQPLGLLFIDLDRFKEINDSLGHAVGDQVLKILAKRLRKIVPKNAFIARLGGDEFTFLIYPLANHLELDHLAEKITQSINKRMPLRKWQLQVTCSIGISTYPESANTADVLLRNADLAMYSAKALGRNSFQYYSESLTKQINHRIDIESTLRYAIANNGFSLVYQPQLNLVTHKIVGVEALLRCQNQHQQTILPNEFIAIAEETSLILPISEWVLKTAAMQAVAWRKEGLNPGVVAINLSRSLMLHDHFLDYILQTLEATGCQPEWLELEVTESMFMQFSEDVIQRLYTLKDMGFGIAIDDFGTGYSSLAMLKNLPINKIKIDKSFLINVPSDYQSRQLIRAITAMTSALKLEIIAEGVEDIAQVNFLTSISCYAAQGFLFFKPQSASEITSILVEDQAQAINTA